MDPVIQVLRQREGGKRRGGGGGAVSKTFFFVPLEPQFGLKIRGTQASRALPLDPSLHMIKVVTFTKAS